jgi:hypothetical protein
MEKGLCCFRVCWGGAVVVFGAGFPGAGRAKKGLPVIPSPRAGWHEAVRRGRSVEINQRVRPRRFRGSWPARSAPTVDGVLTPRAASGAGPGHGDPAAVVDQFELFSGRGHGADVSVAAALSDLFSDAADKAGLRQHFHRFDRRPPHQARALFGDRTAAHRGVGFVVGGRQSSPTGQLGGAGEAVHVPDFGDEHGHQHGPDRRRSAGPRCSRDRKRTGPGQSL